MNSIALAAYAQLQNQQGDPRAVGAAGGPGTETTDPSEEDGQSGVPVRIFESSAKSTGRVRVRLLA